MNPYLLKLKAWYAGLQERDRRVVLIGSVALAALILVGGILLPLQSAVSAAEKRTESRREDLAWMHQNAPEVASAGTAQFNDTGEAPVVVVDRVGRDCDPVFVGLPVSRSPFYTRAGQQAGEGGRVMVSAFAVRGVGPGGAAELGADGDAHNGYAGGRSQRGRQSAARYVRRGASASRGSAKRNERTDRRGRRPGNSRGTSL